MKKILVLLFCFTSGMIYGQKWAVKTNAAYWATTTLNIGGEMDSRFNSDLQSFPL